MILATDSGEVGPAPGPIPARLPDDFPWTEEENQKLSALARLMNCSTPTARQLLVFFLRHIHTSGGILPVAQLPTILAPFPVKWGYKKKRNNFLQLLQSQGFIFVKVNYWAKVRAKRYAVGPAGAALLLRLERHTAPGGPVCRLDQPGALPRRPHADLDG
jgi:hypothetical protein